jgi:hypothetical protein
MDRKRYPRFIAIIFTLIATFHATRVVLGWEAVINGVIVPIWLSGLVAVVAGCIAYQSFKFK